MPNSPPGVTPRQEIDPCLGKSFKDLDYSNEHFTERHILDSNPAYLDRSKYMFYGGVGSRMAAERDPQKRLEIAQQAVINLNNITFTFGGKYRASNGNMIFVYGFPRRDAPGLTVEWFIGVVGKGLPHEGELTNVNTLIVSSDCRRVITSHPGLPRPPFNFSGTQPYYRRL